MRSSESMKLSKPVIVSDNFVVFEGKDACGKTTIIKTVSHLFDSIIEHHDTVLGESVRQLLLDTDNTGKINDLAEMLLYTSQRVQLHSEKIYPALTNGDKIALSRYILSTVAYQGVFLGNPQEVFEKQLELLGMDNTVDAVYLPKKTVFLTAKASEVHRRIMNRSGKKDRLEIKIDDEDLQYNMDNAYMILLEWMRVHYGCEYIVIDTTSIKIDEITRKVKEFLAN